MSSATLNEPIEHFSDQFRAKIMEKNSPWLYVRYIRTYNHGIFKGQKYGTLERITGFK